MSFSLGNILRIKTAVGLSLGEASVRGVRVIRTENGPAIDGAVCINYPINPETGLVEVEEAVREAAESLINEKCRVVTNIQARLCGLHFFQLPFDRPDKIYKVLVYTAEPLFLVPVEEMVLDYVELPKSEFETEMPGLVFGARSETVAGIIDTLGAAGLEPDVVIPDCLGLVEAGQRLFRNDSGEQYRLLLDLGAGHTGMVLFEGGRVVIVRNILYGTKDLTRALAKGLGIDPGRAEEIKLSADLTDNSEESRFLNEALVPLVSEIERTLAGALPGPTIFPPVIVLCGGGAFLKGLPEQLNEHFSLEIQGFDTLTGDETGLADLQPDMLEPFGLALAAMRKGHVPNLRQGEFAPSQALRRYRNPLLLMALGLLLILGFSLGSLYYSYRLENQRVSRIKAEMVRIYQDVMPQGSRVVDPLGQMRQAMDKISGAGSGYGSGGRVLDLLLEVSRTTGSHEDIKITGLTLNPVSVELQGEGGSFEAIDMLKNELAQLPYFSSANLGGARMDPNTRVLAFRITLKRNKE